MSRIPLFDPEGMSTQQAKVYAEVVGGPRGRLVGPLRAAMHNPELADRWQKFGEVLRFNTSLPKRLTELVILVTARRWNSQLEWYIHAQDGLAAGLSPEVIEALRCGESPCFDDPEDADVYEFACQLQQQGNVQQALYERLHRRWGTVAMVDLSSVIGYYTLVAMTLNVHQVPVPDGASHPLQALGRTPDGTWALAGLAPAEQQLAAASGGER
ncbi:carboxymuconolactone decarboxylase family protein [Pseudomonas sp. 3A(2025)]